MGTRGPYTLVDTTPAKTILVYRNGDQFYVGRKFVFSPRHVANFEVLLEQLTAQVDVPFGVRRLYTPTRGHSVHELDALQTGGKYVAAGRERFKKLDYIHIVPRKPSKKRKLKEIKPVQHCDMNVPSRWQSYHRLSRNIKLFTLDGRLVDNSQDLQDSQFYVAAGLENFKSFPYWRSPNVPIEVQEKYSDMERRLQKKKKVTSKEKEPPKDESGPPKTQDSVYYAKQGRKKPLTDPLVQMGTGDVYRAQKPTRDTQGAPDIKEDQDVQVEVPVDQAPAEVIKEDEESESTRDFEGIQSFRVTRTLEVLLQGPLLPVTLWAPRTLA
ncbi:hypothetical protein GHT09_009535 [Marmota monax]|uniref:Doublecortin domain-containing protein n=1 Tax=Marmota monax TaxID=9995 RepID=A0A834PNU6_MARMO|nr:hypothetical protein GHT09_009535 [Marmota monax]